MLFLVRLSGECKKGSKIKGMRKKWERKKRDCFKVWHPRSACRISNERNMTRQYTTLIVAIMIAATCFGYIMIRLNYQQINRFKPRIKSHLLFAGIIRSSPFSPR